MGVRKVSPFQTAKLTLMVTQGHWC